MNWLYGISITCFAACYLVVFLLELTRVFFRAPFRRYFSLAMMLSGVFAHSVYLVLQTSLEFTNTGLLMGSWSGWCLAAAWFMVVACLWFNFRQPESLTGVFILPLVMALVAVSSWQAHETTFSPSDAKTIWNTIHGLSFLAGTVSVVLGFVFGSMYLLQARRLKRKIPLSKMFRYPSLEWLQGTSEMTLIASLALLGLGLISGIAINLINLRNGGGVLPWTDPVILSSAVLFGWLLAVTLFNAMYKPARQGRKVAYLVLASFIFLALELGLVWCVGHANQSTQAINNSTHIQSDGFSNDEFSIQKTGQGGVS